MFPYFLCLAKGSNDVIAMASTSFVNNSLGYSLHLASVEISLLASFVIKVTSSVRGLNTTTPNAFIVSLAAITIITIVAVTIIKFRSHIVIAADG